MHRAALVRAGGMAAIIGGVLRAVSSTVPAVGSDAERQLLYLVIDGFLLLGVLGFYELHYQDLGRSGAVGFLLALVGLLVVRSSRAIPGLDLYPAGALAFVGGLIVICLSAWRAKTAPIWLSMAFLASIIVGLAAMVRDPAGWVFVVSGVIFGVAFAGLGCETWITARQSNSAP